MLVAHLQQKNAGRILVSLLFVVVLAGLLIGCGYDGKIYNVSISSPDKMHDTFDQSGLGGQKNLTVLMYDSLVFTNTTDQNLALVTSPDGGLPSTSVVAKNSSLTVQLTKVGTWTISSKEHPELQMVVVVQ